MKHIVLSIDNDQRAQLQYDRARLSWINIGLSSTRPGNASSTGALGKRQEGKKVKSCGQRQSEGQEGGEESRQSSKRAEEERPDITETKKYERENVPNSNFC